MSRGPSVYLALALIVSACATSLDQSNWFESIRRAPETEGAARTFSADYDKTLKAAEEALDDAGLRWVALNRSGMIFADLPRTPTVPLDTTVWSLYATKRMERGWNGEQVRVIVQATGPNQTMVRVLSKYRTETIAGRRGDYSEPILNGIARKLN